MAEGGSPNAPRASLFDVEDLVLESNPIEDIDQRLHAAEQIQAQREAERLRRAAEAKRRLEEKPGDVTPVTPRSRRQISESQFSDAYTLLEPTDGPEPPSASVPRKSPSVFDEDLPELKEDKDPDRLLSLPGINLDALAAEFNSQPVERPSHKAEPPPKKNSAAWDEEIIEVDRRRHQRTQDMLKQAQADLETEESENRNLGTDFDTAGFLRRTFGFLLDPIALGAVLGYGLSFALIFAMIQYGISSDGSAFGRGAALFCMLTGPVLGVLFGLPLISAAMAQLESVANRQDRVVDWPGFNVYDNLGDTISVLSALAASAIPGLIIGSWIGGDLEGSGRIQIAGVMMTTLVLFPIFLLSILDNGSFLHLISEDVIRSIREVSEAWGSYYLKTLIVFSVTLILWLLLLGEGKSALLAAVGGALLPGLVFFTFQQLGCLADAIGENLSARDEESSERSDKPKDDSQANGDS
jgi:hypothetical protein